MLCWQKNEFPSFFPKMRYIFQFSPTYHLSLTTNSMMKSDSWHFKRFAVSLARDPSSEPSLDFNFQSVRQLFIEMILLINNWYSRWKWYIFDFIHGFHHDFARINIFYRILFIYGHELCWCHISLLFGCVLAGESKTISLISLIPWIPLFLWSRWLL